MTWGRRKDRAAADTTDSTMTEGEQLAQMVNKLLACGFSKEDLARLCFAKDEPVDENVIQLWADGDTTGFSAGFHARRLAWIDFAVRSMVEKWGISPADTAVVFMYTPASIGRTLADRLNDAHHNFGEAVQDLIRKDYAEAVRLADKAIAAIPAQQELPLEDN